MQQWNIFSDFTKQILFIPKPLPATPHTVALFIAHLYSRGKKYHTILTYISAIAYFHRVNLHPDPTDNYLISKSLQGVKNTCPPTVPLSPVTQSLLSQLCHGIWHASIGNYTKAMLQSMFTLMYFGCLRIGEVATSTHNDNTLQLNQLSLQLAAGTLKSLCIDFKSFKHSGSKIPNLTIIAQADRHICPVYALANYIKVRGSKPGPLYLDCFQVPINRSKFVKLLKISLDQVGLSNTNINTHSFRVGRATDLSLSNYSDTHIQEIGRWRSNAYKRYIRPSAVSS